MLVLISPAKTLDFDTPPRTREHSTPAHLTDSAALIGQLKKLSPADLSDLMGISDKLAVLNSTRYQTWKQPFTLNNAKQAALAFRGDVYTGLDADTMTADDDRFAQNHLRILSGLYGLLKPLDLIQPYRLEMGVSFKNKKGKDLYQFWGEKITAALNSEIDGNGYDTVINLASKEYFKAIKPKLLSADIVTPVFKDFKNGNYKVISFFAKKARGLMARYIIQNRIEDPQQLKAFNVSGYAYNADLSSDREWVFTRREQ